MMRNLKALGLALVAVFAMSAVVASAASASTKGWLTSDGPVTLTGTDTVGERSELTAFGQALACHGHYHIGTTNKPETYDEFFDVSKTTVTSITVKPTYTNCETTGTESPVTITMNGCDFTLHIGETAVGGGAYTVTADIVCPETKQIELHHYSRSSHATTICTTKIPGGQNGIAGGTAKTAVDAEGNHTITLQGPFKGFTSTKTGILCGGSAHTENAELDIHAILSGFNEEGGATGITITHATE